MLVTICLRIAPSLSKPKMIFFGNPGNSEILNFWADASSSNRRTIGRFHFSKTWATLAISFKAWLVGSWPTPITPVMKYPRPVWLRRLTSWALAVADAKEPPFSSGLVNNMNFDSESKLPITVTSVEEVRKCISMTVVPPFSTWNICISASTPPLARRVPVTSE